MRVGKPTGIEMSSFSKYCITVIELRLLCTMPSWQSSEVVSPDIGSSMSEHEGDL